MQVIVLVYQTNKVLYFALESEVNSDELVAISETFLIVCPIIGIILILYRVWRYGIRDFTLTVISLGFMILNLIIEINKIRFSPEDNH